MSSFCVYVFIYTSLSLSLFLFPPLAFTPVHRLSISLFVHDNGPARRGWMIAKREQSRKVNCDHRDTHTSTLEHYRTVINLNMRVVSQYFTLSLPRLPHISPYDNVAPPIKAKAVIFQLSSRLQQVCN